MRQQNGKATIRDVARLAEVSVSSVSRYLADPGSVRAYSAYRIRDAIRQLGYEPNAFAQGLRQGRGHTVGMVVPNLEFFCAKACRAVSDYFYERGQAVFVCSSDGDPAKEQFFIRQLQRQRVAGLIVSSCGLNPVFLEQQARQDIPLVLLDGDDPVPCDLVSVDYQEAARRMTEHLLQAAQPTHLHLLLGEQAAARTHLCEAGVRDALPAAGGPSVHSHYGCRREGRMPAAAARVARDAARGKPGVLAFEPEFLEQTVVQLNQQDPALLGQVALSGMAMSNTCDKLGAGLSCLVQDAAWAGVTAAQALYRRIHEGAKNEPPQVYRVPVRASWDE